MPPTNSNKAPAKNDAPDAPLAILNDFIRDIVRTEPLVPFHKAEIYRPFSSSLRSRVGVAPEDEGRFRALLEQAAKNAEAECPALAVKLGSSHSDSIYGITVSVKPGGEWRQVQNWAFGSEDGARCLSPAAAELLTRIEEGDIGTEFISELSVRRRIQLQGFGTNVSTLAEEIRMKRGIKLTIEEKGDRWNQRKRLLKITVESREDAVAAARALNPTVPADIVKDPAAARRFQRWFKSMLANGPWDGAELEHIWSISSRAEFYRCFSWIPSTTAPNVGEIVEWLRLVQHHPVFDSGWNLAADAGTWTVAVRPKRPWSEVKAALRAELARKTPEDEFGLSSPAAALLEWLRSLSAEQRELGLSPVVEDAIENKELLLRCPWPMENLTLYLRILCDEIGRKAGCAVEAVTWTEEDRQSVRLWVRDMLIER